MIPDIKSKIKLKLDKERLEESDVVYLLIEIGKLIELTNTKDRYASLWFYRNWIAHSQIDKQTAFIKDLKSKLEKINLEKGQAISAIFGFASFIDLKINLIQFFSQEIESQLLSEESFFESFQRSLVQVLADVPIKIKFEDRIVEFLVTQRDEFIIRNLLKLEIKMTLKRVSL